MQENYFEAVHSIFFISMYQFYFTTQMCSINYMYILGRDGVFSIATSYGLDGPGIESQWGRDFLHPSRPALGPTEPPVQWVLGLSWG